MNKNPIGVFDSGVGGLSVFSKLVKLLPDENYIYFGDTANLPYGNKTKQQLIEISKRIFDFFELKKVKAVVMACNTTSAIVYDTLKKQYQFEIYPIIQSIAKCISDKKYNSIGVFATLATINAHAYKKELQLYNPLINVYEMACPQWVSIVEQMKYNETSLDNIKSTVNKMLSNNVEKIILGCTHYPYLLDILSKFAPKSMFIDPSEEFAQFIANDINKKDLLNSKEVYPPEFFVSGDSKQFLEASKLFYKIDYTKKFNQIELDTVF